MKRLFYVLALLLCATAVIKTHDVVNAEQARFYKEEHGTGAEYLELVWGGRYRLIGREHMGASLTEEGHWRQKGSVITFRPSTALRGGEMVRQEGKSYEGTEVEYKGRTFIAFNAEDALGIVIPVDETKKELDGGALSAPMYVFFKTSARVYDLETKQPYPFRYVKPDDWR